MTLEFDGPPNFHVFGNLYVTLSHGGLKAEGEECPGPPIMNRSEAESLFASQLTAFTKGADQIAWRRRPTVEQEKDGSWKVTARLAVFRHD